MFMQICLGNSVGGTQCEHYAFHRYLLRGQGLTILDRHRILYISVKIGFIPAAPVRFNETVGTRTKSDIRDMTPIGRIMTGLESRKSEVRYLVMGITGLMKRLTQHFILMFTELFAGLLPLSALYKLCQSASGFYRKLV